VSRGEFTIFWLQVHTNTILSLVLLLKITSDFRVVCEVALLNISHPFVSELFKSNVSPSVS
jgi:hypothetical protein